MFQSQVVGREKSDSLIRHPPWYYIEPLGTTRKLTIKLLMEADRKFWHENLANEKKKKQKTKQEVENFLKESHNRISSIISLG